MATKRAKMLWYCISCEPGRDKRVRRELMRAYKLRGLEKEFGRVFIPHHIEEKPHPVTGVVGPRRVKSFPGYLLVNMRFTGDTFHLVKGLGRIGVFGFLDPPPQLGGRRYPKKEKMQRTPVKPWELEKRQDWKPCPIHPLEIAVLMEAEKRGIAVKKEHKKAMDRAARTAVPVEAEPTGPRFEVGDGVRITEGMCKGLVGKVVKAAPSSYGGGQVLTVHVLLLGKMTPVVVGNQHVEKFQ
jgi:transcription antitermination factor NusG